MASSAAFGEALHQDIARAVEGGFDVRHALVGIDVAFSQLFRLLLRILPQRVRQRFQTGLDGDLPRVRRFGLYGR